jgi:hypothetical protein
MSETTFPRRDADGRVVHLAELLAWVGAGLVVGFVALLAAAVGSGAVGAAISTFLYATLWYVGIRWLAERGVPR